MPMTLTNTQIDKFLFLLVVLSSYTIYQLNQRI